MAWGLDPFDYDVAVEEKPFRNGAPAYWVYWQLNAKNVAGGAFGFWVDPRTGRILQTYLYQ
ncbi:MAG: hypothetical protein ABI629_12495 [bacterium]